MRCCSLLFSAALGGVAVAPAPAATDPAASLEDYRWKKRVVLIAAPSPTDAGYLRQAGELARIADELAARNVEVVLAGPGDPRRTRLPLAADELVVLVIGLDGGIKLSRRGFLTSDELRKELDSVPLRRSELKAAERARQKGEAGAPVPAARMKEELALTEAAPGGGWSKNVHREGAANGRSWLFDLPVSPGPLQAYPAGAALWHLKGDPLEVLVFPRVEKPYRALLGPGGAEAKAPVLQLQAGDRISARLRPGSVNGWALLGETSSGAEPADEELGRLAELFPEHAAWIRSIPPRPLRAY